MELSRKDTTILKGMAILLMINLHLFARKDIDGLYVSFFWINDVPVEYYVGLLGDACRPIYLFATGYAFYIVYKKNQETFVLKNFRRILKLSVNFWIVLVMFVSIGILTGQADTFPGSASKFFQNFFFLSNSYNGAWWFLQVYIIITLLSPILIKLVKRYNPIALFLGSGVIYFICYVQFYKNIINVSDYDLLSSTVSMVTLLGTSQLSFIIGSIFAKERIYTKIHNKFSNIEFKNTLCALGIFSLIIFHGIIESAIIGPINGILFVCLFSLMNKSILVQKVLTYLSNHSTNLWLIHMFFYTMFIPQVTFFPEYPPLIFIWLIVLCLITSHVIKLLYKPIFNLIDKRSQKMEGEGHINIS
ncbi:acyltransferase [Salipaludibacillus neizhouensis]|uniref:Acyltransferase n=1 Tax=Salipaludibacillus neizhouensis TaxID=885475 RepID=A0A3A9K266_9BACI|nr:acyltransferase [Salipaludibacillus neizhouensis]RKL66429.1 acyltransferase [Salipaludibacillus neizhouensis]